MSDRFAVGYVYDVECATSFQRSLAELKNWDMGTRRRYVEEHCVRFPTDGMADARNSVVSAFLASPNQPDWLFWIDTDMGFTPQIVDELMSAAHPVERPIVGALCFMQAEYALDGMSGHRTSPVVTIFKAADGGALTSLPWFPVNTLVRCDGTGSACILIHRTVFEKIRKRDGDVWYDRIRNPETGVLVSEDLSFCMRTDAPVYVYTKAKTTHLKRVWLSDEDFWRRFQPPPASVETAVIVPVLRRPQNAEPFMKWLRASTGMATVYAVADADDQETYNAWKAAGAQTLMSATELLTFPKKANFGYQNTAEPYLFLCGDDVRFHPGWLDHAQHVMETENCGVVGTQDGGNPAVRRGDHATHPLISRAYVDELGASWDGPGVLVCESYRHNFCDNEWTTVAKQHGKWGFAAGANVEHLHPNWTRRASDDTYKKGAWSFDRDRQLFEKRVRQYVRGAA